MTFLQWVRGLTGRPGADACGSVHYLPTGADLVWLAEWEEAQRQPPIVQAVPVIIRA